MTKSDTFQTAVSKNHYLLKNIMEEDNQRETAII